MLHYPITYYWINILEIQSLDYMFYMFLTCIPIFMLIGCNLPTVLQTLLLSIILNYNNLNLDNWLMTCLLISDHFKILYTRKVYEDNVIYSRFIKIYIKLRNIGLGSSYTWCNSKRCYTYQSLIIEFIFWKSNRWIAFSICS